MALTEIVTERTPTGSAPDRSPSRDDPPGRPAARSAGGATPPVGRQLYCSTACRKTAFRRRHQEQLGLGGHRPGRPAPPGDHRLECPDCGDRYLGEQRCEGCGTFARRVGIGGAGPNCDGPVAISDLLDQAVVTITNK